MHVLHVPSARIVRLPRPCAHSLRSLATHIRTRAHKHRLAIASSVCASNRQGQRNQWRFGACTSCTSPPQRASSVCHAVVRTAFVVRRGTHQLAMIATAQVRTHASTRPPSPILSLHQFVHQYLYINMKTRAQFSMPAHWPGTPWHACTHAPHNNPYSRTQSHVTATVAPLATKGASNWSQPSSPGRAMLGPRAATLETFA